MLVSLHGGRDKSGAGKGVQKARTRLSVLMNLVKDVEYDSCVIHQPMVGPLHRFYFTPFLAHGLFQPLHGTFGDPLVLITIPYSDRVRVVLVRETPWNAIVVQDQEEVVMRAFSGFRV